MTRPVEFDLRTFQGKVIQEYDFLKRMKKLDSEYFENPYKKYADESVKQNPLSKLVWTSIFKIIGSIEKQALQSFSEHAEVSKYEKNSNDLIFHPKIKQILCPVLQEKVLPELLEEENEIEVIKILTLLLTKESIVEELSIDLDAKLFAFMTHGILQNGVEDYCQNRQA